MTVTRPRAHRPTPRRRVAVAGVLLFVVALAGLLQLVDLLRHPFPGDLPVVPPGDEGDPRVEPECPEPRPHEGEERAAPRVGPADEPQAANSEQLYDCPESWHQRRVRYRGEVVGAVLHRAGGAWVQLNDDVYAGDVGPLPAHRDYRGGNAGVGVYVPAELAARVERVGGPRHRGDIVEVVGTFHRMEPDHREVAVIVADSGDVVARGAPIPRPLLTDRLVAAIVLTLLAGGVVAAERLSARRRW